MIEFLDLFCKVTKFSNIPKVCRTKMCIFKYRHKNNNILCNMNQNAVAYNLTAHKIAIPKKRSCNNENVYCKFQDYIHLSIFKLQRRSAPNNAF